MTFNFTFKKNCLAFLIALGALTSVKAQNYSVALERTFSQYVNCGNDPSLNATNIKTLECWVKFNSLLGNQEILSRSTFYSGIELVLLNGDLNFFCMRTQPISSFVRYDLTNLQPDTWYHIAGSFDGTKESMRLYVNGVSVGTRVDFSDINANGGISDPAGNFLIGQWSEAGDDRYLDGEVEEARVWSTQRTAAEIKAGMYGAVPTNSTGLLAYYKANEGAGTTLVNNTGNMALDGTLVNGPTWAASPVQPGNNALNFDGVDDQVIVPANPTLDITTGTIECWLQPNNLSPANEACFLSNRSDDLTRYSFHITNQHIGLWNGSSYVTIPYTFNNGNWYHIAFVSGPSLVEAYVNGVLIGDFGAGIAYSGQTGRPLVFGIAKNLSGDGEPFTGSIEDVRIWNVQRTAAEILANRFATFTGTESGLAAYYTFDQGIGNGNNDGLLFAIDGTPNNNNGLLTNMAVNGTTSNWVTSSYNSLPVKYTYFTATKENDIAVLRWETAQEQDSKSFIIERSTDAKNFFTIGSLPAAGNSNFNIAYNFSDHAPEAGDNYYRLKQVDIDNKFEYSKVVSLRFPLVSGLKIAPNPVKHTLLYSVTGLKKTQASMILTDMNGRNVLVKSITIQAGVNRFSESIGNLPSGNYTLQINNPAQSLQLSQRLVIAK